MMLSTLHDHLRWANTFSVFDAIDPVFHPRPLRWVQFHLTAFTVLVLCLCYPLYPSNTETSDLSAVDREAISYMVNARYCMRTHHRPVIDPPPPLPDAQIPANQTSNKEVMQRKLMD